MLTKSVIVALVLLAMVNRSLSLSCRRCTEAAKADCRPSPTCSYGMTKGVCGCCDVCAKGPGETCGGQWGLFGTCSEGFTCNEPYSEGICVRILRSDWKWILETDACIIGENNAALDGISLDDCKVSCQDQSEFACRSLEYHFNSRRCILSEATSNSSNYRQPCPYKGGWIYTEMFLWRRGSMSW